MESQVNFQVLLNDECSHLLPKCLCRKCSAAFWQRMTVTGRIPEPPERQKLRPTPNYRIQAEHHEIASVDFVDVERKVIARYRPKHLPGDDNAK